MASNCSCEHNLINTSKTKKKPQLSLRLKKPWYIYIYIFSSCETYNRSWSLKSSELRNGKPQFQKPLCVFARCDDLTRPDWFWFGWSSLKWQPCPALLFYSLGHSRFFPQKLMLIASVMPLISSSGFCLMQPGREAQHAHLWMAIMREWRWSPSLKSRWKTASTVYC